MDGTPCTWLKKGYLLVPDLLLVKGADPNEAGKDGGTPLYGAAVQGHLLAADLLLVKSADPNKADKTGWAP